MSRNSKMLFSKDNRYSIRKMSVGVASVLIGYVMISGNQVQAEELMTGEETTTIITNHNDRPSDLSNNQHLDRAEVVAESSQTPPLTTVEGGATADNTVLEQPKVLMYAAAAETSDVESRPDDNHLLNVTATASNVESGTDFTAAKAVDGNDASRWATDQNAEKPSLTMTLPKATEIKRFEIDWDKRTKNSTDDPNINSWKLYYANGTEDSVTENTQWIEAHHKTGTPQVSESVSLANPITAKHLKLQVEDYVSGTMGWRNVSIRDVRAFTNDVAENSDAPTRTATNLNEVEAISLNDDNTQVVLPELEGVSLIGSELSGVIDLTGKVYQPLTTQQVKIFVRQQTGSTTIDKEFTVTVPGQYNDEGVGVKPVVAPVVQQWHGIEGTSNITSATKIVADSAFTNAATQYINDVKTRGLTLTTGSASDSKRIEFKKVTDKGYAKEGYGIQINNDVITIEAQEDTGAFYATRTLLQLGQTNLQNGEIRDFPAYEHRGFMLDTGRKFVPYETVMDILENMAYYKLNDLQLHLNDNLIFLNQKIEQAGLQNATAQEKYDYLLANAEEGFRIEVDYENNGKRLTSEDHYTTAQFKNIIKRGQELGVNIVPEFDTPGHALSFVKVRPDLMYKGTISGGHHDVERVAMLDLETKYDETLAFVKSIYDKMLDGDDAVLKGIDTFHIGTDEYYGGSANYRRYLNDMITYIKGKGLTPRFWGSLSRKTGEPAVNLTGSEMHVWNTSWQNPQHALRDGAKIINILDAHSYSVPNGDGRQGAYRDYISNSAKYQNGRPHQFGNTQIKVSNPNLLGGAYAVWNDNIDIVDTGLTSYDIFKRFFHTLAVSSDTTWGSHRQPTQFSERVDIPSIHKYAPGTNPEFSISEAQTFTLNKETLPQFSHTVASGDAIEFGTGQSVTTPVEAVGPGAILTVDVKRTGEGEQILATNGNATIYLADSDGKIAYDFEQYHVQFDGEIPLNERANIVVATSNQQTDVYLNGRKLNRLPQENMPNFVHTSFVMPLKTIGGFEGELYNLALEKGVYVDASIVTRDNIYSITATSEHIGSETNEGPISLAFDNNEGTIWHSHWDNTDDTYAVNIQLKEAMDLTALSYLPRQSGGDNGKVTQYEVYAEVEGEFVKVSEGTWDTTINEKHATFNDTINTKRIQLKVLTGTGGYASASEIRLLKSVTPITAPNESEQQSVDKEAAQIEEDKVEEARERNFNQDWYFKLTTDTNLGGVDVDVADWRKLDLPHDWSIFFDFDDNSPGNNEAGLLNGGQAWYRKHFTLPEEDLGKNVRVLFDGVYMDSKVYVNGQYIGNYPNGYNHFSYDISPYLTKDGSENVIAVQVTNKQPSSRWYSGSGITRDVSILVTDPVHVALNGQKITTPQLKEQHDGLVDTIVSTKISNDDEQSHSVFVEHQVLKSNGEIVSDAVRSEKQTISGAESAQFNQTVQVDTPTLWTIKTDTPQLYIMRTKVFKDDKLVDVQDETFGYRYIEWTPEGGFFLNGESTKFYGVSLHQDHGALGSEDSYKAEYRRLKKMKEMGVNAIRTTHNPASRHMLNIAAEIGLLVQEEAFDTWYDGKKTYDYGRFFEKTATHPEALEGEVWSDYDLRTMVERDRNNPAIIMWSIGNEIAEVNGGPDKAVQTARRLVRTIKAADNTRYVTIGANQYAWSSASNGADRVMEELDAVGLNYGVHNFDRMRELHPTWLLYGSETSSATRSRGIYYRPDRELVQDHGADREFQQSDYGNDRVSWGRTATSSWVPDRDRIAYAGQFIWTGTDYIGEPTPWHNMRGTPPKSSYFGIVDTAGLEKNDFYLYQSQWLSASDNPMVHILPHWNWEDEALREDVLVNGKIPVRTFSNAASVELFLNDTSLGSKSFKLKTTSDGRLYQEGASADKLYLEWLVPYTPGKLEAIARNDQGEIIARDMVVTAGKPHSVQLLKEDHVITADGQDLAYIQFAIMDEQGNIVPTATNLVHFNLQGQGEIVGVDNGDAASRERYKAQPDGTWQRQAFSGMGVVIVKSTESTGQFTLTATSDHLVSDEATVFTTKDLNSEATMLGIEPVKVSTLVNHDATMPETVTAIYSDGSLKVKAVNWQYQHDAVTTTGLKTVHGTVDGFDEQVSATLQVVGVKTILPVIKTVQTNTAKSAIDRQVNVVMTDGTLATYQVSNWQMADESRLSRVGDIQTTGTITELNQTVNATIKVVGTPTETEANLTSMTLGNDPLTGFSPNTHSYKVSIGYGEAMLPLSATAQVGATVTIDQATAENDRVGTVYVTSNDGTLSEYKVRYIEATPAITSLTIDIPNKDQLVEDQEVPFTVIGHYQDGSTAELKPEQLIFTSSSNNGGKVVIVGDQLQAHESGNVTLVTQLADSDITLSTHLTITANPDVRHIVKVRPVNVKTGLNTPAKLPTTVIVEFDQGFPRERTVTWQNISSDQYTHYHTFTVEGTVEGTSIKGIAAVSVEGIIAVDNAAITVVKGERPKLPETINIYHSTGKSETVPVTWEVPDSIDFNESGRHTVIGRVDGTDLVSNLQIRVSDQTMKTKNISDQWTGSELPAAFADHSAPADPVRKINDKVSSFNNQPNNRWTDWNEGRTHNAVGILFGDAGNLTKRYVDNFNIAFYVDSGVGIPKDYTIEYFTGEDLPKLPSNLNNIESDTEHPFNDDRNWTAVTNLKVNGTANGALSVSDYTHFTFDKVETAAVRISMTKSDDKVGLAMTEVQIFASEVPAKTEGQVRIQLDDVPLQDFNPDVHDYYVTRETMPNVTAQVTQFGVATIIPSPNDSTPTRIIVKSEKNEVLSEYRIHTTRVANGEGVGITLPAFDLEADADQDGFTNAEELAKGTDSENAESKPTMHHDSGEPSEPSEPSEPIEPSEPNKPNEPSEPNKPSEPSEPNKPSEPSEPNKPSEPSEPNKPSEPSEPNKPSEPSEPNKPSEPSEPNKPSEPSEPNKPSEPSEPNKPSEPNTVIELPLYETDGVNVTVDKANGIVTFEDNNLDSDGVKVTLPIASLNSEATEFVVEKTSVSEGVLVEAYFIGKDGQRKQITGQATVTIPVLPTIEVENVFYLPEDSAREAVSWEYVQGIRDAIEVTVDHFSKYLVTYRVQSTNTSTTSHQVGNATPIVVEPNTNVNGNGSQNTTVDLKTNATTDVKVTTADNVRTQAKATSSDESTSSTSTQTSLPQTGENDGLAIFGAAALSVLAGLGLALPVRKEE